MQIWRSLKNDVYLHKVKGGLCCPPFFVTFLLKTSFEEGFSSFEVGNFSFEEKFFSFEEGKNCAIFGKNLLNNVSFS